MARKCFPQNLARAVPGLLVVWCCTIGTSAAAAESIWVKTGVTGRLIYVPDAQGDRILDFSNVGYRGQGTESIPAAVPTAITISPIAGDDTAHIQAAINQVSALPLGPDGFRGAVLLQAGDYDIATKLSIAASGVVLRGVGRDVNQTVLHARGTGQRSLIEVVGSGSQSLTGSARNMIDKVVPVGSRSFRVDSTTGFSVGDTVRVTRPTPANWISELGMDMIPPRSDGGTINQWTTTLKLRYDRVITRIEGNRIFVDAPLPQSFDQNYGGGTIQRYNWTNRIENVGIENLRGDSDFTSATDENHGWEFISIDSAQNVWVQNILSKHFGKSSVVTNPGSKWVTVDNAINESPISIVTGGRRYTFDLSGELDLVTNSVANEGRHDFVNNSTQPGGPHVFHNSVAHTALDESGPHQRWATGTLFDNITIEGDQINARNRGNFGSGHGWAGANMVIWNSKADSFIVQNPPTSQNWLVGSQGTIIEDTTFGPQPSGYYDQSGPTATPVTAGGVTSLYEAQMNDARTVVEFHDQGSTGNWVDSAAWNQELAPLDTYQISFRDYLVGDIDGMTYDGASSVDNAYIDPAWNAEIANSSALPLTKFDDASGNENIAFTIQHTLDPGERVVHASLALALRQAGDSTATDFIRLFNMNPENRVDFSELGWDSQINNSETFVGVLDLGGKLANLQTGNVNVQINDDTALDWALYSTTIATPCNNASAAAVYLDQGGNVTIDSSLAPIGQLVLGGEGTGTLRIATEGILSVGGDYSQSAGGTLEVELGEASSTIAVGGTANLGGLLQVSLLPGYSPVAGDEFGLLSATSLVGSFSDVQLPAVDNGLRWNLDYGQNDVNLTALFAADFDLNGTVDSMDLAIWQTAYSENTAGDADGDGDTDGRDFLIWQKQFGGSISTVSQSLSVPEPDSARLLIICCLMTVSLCRISRSVY